MCYEIIQFSSVQKQAVGSVGVSDFTMFSKASPY